MIDDLGNPRLTQKGLKEIEAYKPNKLGNDAQLLVSFDIPEEERHKRRHLRTLLKELKFKQVQRSVWSTQYDHRQYLKAEIKQYGLEDYVLVYEVQALKL